MARLSRAAKTSTRTSRPGRDESGRATAIRAVDCQRRPVDAPHQVTGRDVLRRIAEVRQRRAVPVVGLAMLAHQPHDLARMCHGIGGKPGRDHQIDRHAIDGAQVEQAPRQRRQGSAPARHGTAVLRIVPRRPRHGDPSVPGSAIAAHRTLNTPALPPGPARAGPEHGSAFADAVPSRTCVLHHHHRPSPQTSWSQSLASTVPTAGARVARTSAILCTNAMQHPPEQPCRT